MTATVTFTYETLHQPITVTDTYKYTRTKQLAKQRHRIFALHTFVFSGIITPDPILLLKTISSTKSRRLQVIADMPREETASSV